jgi:hypothetical protein
MVPATDADLLARQSALQAEAGELLAVLDLAAAVADIGPLLPTGSYVSGLMCWRDLDLGLLAGAGFAPRDVLGLLARLVDRPGITGFDYRDERGVRSPTGERRDERYHLPVRYERPGGAWRVDLSIWLHDAHRHVHDWHRGLRDTVTAEQRLSILRIKDVWHRRPGYPDAVSGWEVYRAVLEDGVRGPDGFAAWLAAHGLPPG